MRDHEGALQKALIAHLRTLLTGWAKPARQQSRVRP